MPLASGLPWRNGNLLAGGDGAPVDVSLSSAAWLNETSPAEFFREHWHYGRTSRFGDMHAVKGPYSSERSVALMIARELLKDRQARRYFSTAPTVLWGYFSDYLLTIGRIGMPIATLNRETINVQFQTNMKRIGAITTFLHSGVENSTPTGFLRSEGVRADILRASLVFLHAAIEDFVRSHLPRPNKHFTLSSEVDIKRALSRLNIDSRPFAHLFPPFTQLAKRRHQMVHRADLQVGKIEAVSAWEVADEWQLIYWNLAVVAFYHRIRAATGPIGKVEQRALANAENGLVNHVEFGGALIALKGLPTEERMEGLKKLIELLEELRNTLKLEVEMFLGPDGEPIEGAIVK